jgi:hypothetical protein
MMTSRIKAAQGWLQWEDREGCPILPSGTTPSNSTALNSWTRRRTLPILPSSDTSSSSFDQKTRKKRHADRAAAREVSPRAPEWEDWERREETRVNPEMLSRGLGSMKSFAGACNKAGRSSGRRREFPSTDCLVNDK